MTEEIPLFTDVEEWPVEELEPYGGNPKKHPPGQIERIRRSIEEFGFTIPILVDDGGEIIAGHGRLEAAEEIGMESVAVIHREDLSDEQAKALRIADNKVAESDWDEQALADELADIDEFDLDNEISGFAEAEFEDLITVPEFEPVGEEDQPDLDETNSIECPDCGHEWNPEIGS